MTFYRVAQETLQNVVKHSQATQATVCLEALPLPMPNPGVDLAFQVRLEISDNGVGFDAGATPMAGLGLRIMSERSESIDAGLTVASSPGQGTQVTLTWPDGQQTLAQSTVRPMEASAEAHQRQAA
jgi:signal transduction histidine kinase